MVNRIVHKNIILLILALAQFMVVLDVSIMNVALPSILRALHFNGPSSLQWVVTAYTLTFGGFLLLGGRAADLFGRKRVFLSAVSVFSMVSLICGLAQNSVMLEVSRAVQGMAAAFMSPAALSIVLTTFTEGSERNKALSVWGAVAASGAAVGVLLGGILTQYLSWRWNFFVNVPVGIGVILATLRFVPESSANLKHRQLDLYGALLVTSGLMFLVFAITRAPIYGWSSNKTLWFLSISLALLVNFVINELRVQHPLVPLGIFKIRNVAGANLVQLPTTASLFAMFFFLSLYMQTILGYSPVKAGLSFLPVPLTIGLTASRMSRIVGRVGYKIPLVVAPLLMATGLFYLSHIRANDSYVADVLPGLLIMAAGLGTAFITITIAATSGVPPHQSGLASGLLTTSQQIGGSLGLAILSGVASSFTMRFLMGHPHTPATLVQAQVEGYRHAFLVGAGFALFASVLALVLIKAPKGQPVGVPNTAGG